jgi:hypothetical protein
MVIDAGEVMVFALWHMEKKQEQGCYYKLENLCSCILEAARAGFLE